MKRPILAFLIGAAVAAPTFAGDDAGEAIFNRECYACHGPGGDRPGTLQLGLTRGADKALLAERTDLTPDYIRHVVRNGLVSMPSFTPVGLKDAELEQLINYLMRN